MKINKFLITILLLITIVFSSNLVVADKTIRVYGNVYLDGEPLENAEIKLKNLDRGFEISTNTDSDGYYDIFTTARDHEQLKVTVNYEDLEDSITFEIITSQEEYEINFNLEDSNGNNNNGPINGDIIKEFLMLLWDCLISISIIDLIKYLFLLLLLILIIKLLIPKRNYNERSMDNDTIIVYGNGKIKKI